MRREIVAAVRPVSLSPAQVASAFRKRLARGLRIRSAGDLRDDPERLLSLGYGPRYAFELFGTWIHLSGLRQNETFRSFVAWLRLPGAREVHVRLFYKDSSLVWRCATHFIRSEHENWIGKGDLKVVRDERGEIEYAAEETTNLPLEIQPALDELSRRSERIPKDDRVFARVLRRAPDQRMAPYRDFSEPRRRAMAVARNRVNRGESVAWFERENDPGSLRFAPGFEPDFEDGVLETCELSSSLYGGKIRKFRILSANREIQYQFIAGPHQVWIVPPQTLTTELSSYGVRTVDVNAHEDVFVPGYEYHYLDDSVDPPELHSQIPLGFAGKASEVDPMRADASRWLEQLPVIREFRRSAGR